MPRAVSVGDAAERAALASAIALDTVEAARAARAVGELVVVGGLPEQLPGVRVIDDPGGGLLAAVQAGLAVLDADLPTAVLLGDLPALQPDELLAGLRGGGRA
ncbi:MAG: NTP transferase domain-containing protein [Microcella pacifica]